LLNFCGTICKAISKSTENKGNNFKA